jgi:hypothetical protein
MKHLLSKWIRGGWPVLFLFLIELFLAAKNITPGTWLTGWDSTQPELNFALNLSRSLSSAWQEYRGLGLADGMAHAANIIHLLYIWMLSLVVPDSLIRYAFVFIAHLTGAVGMYALLRYLLKQNTWLAFAGSIFYLLSPITIQMFYQPLELFVIHFAGLPWLLLTVINYLEQGGKGNLFWLFLVLLIFVSQNHVPTIFVVTMMVVGIMLLLGFIDSFGKHWKRVLTIGILILGVNSFWLLPYASSVSSNSQVIPQAKINRLSNEEVILRNSAYGDLSHVARMEGFALSYEDWQANLKIGLQMSQWNAWWDGSIVTCVQWVIFGLALIGILRSLVTRNWKLLGISFIWILGLFNLGVRIPVIEQMMSWIYTSIPLYGAVFRFAFTKFSIVFAFASAALAMYALDWWRKWWLHILTAVLIIAGSFWIAQPAFLGEFLYRPLKIVIPNEYRQLFAYFNTAEVGRVAMMPVPDLWGWQLHSWGYRGSGIVWQGVKSPILMRSFDPWSSYNETFYNEFSTALYGLDKPAVQRVLDKHDVRYVLLDESIIAPGQDASILRLAETRELMKSFEATQVFHEGSLTVWDMGLRGNQFVSASPTYVLAEGETTYGRVDVIAAEHGTYIQGRSILYPFAQLMHEEIQDVTYGSDHITLRAILPEHASQLTVPAFNQGERVQLIYREGRWAPAYRVGGQDGPKLQTQVKGDVVWAVVGEPLTIGQTALPVSVWDEYLRDQVFTLSGTELQVEIPSLPITYDFLELGKPDVKNCDVLARGSAFREGSIYTADARGAACDYVVMSQLDTRSSYLMRIQGENLVGLSLKLYLYNDGSQRNDLEYLLSSKQFDHTFALLPWSFSGKYSLNIVTRSFGEKSQNDLAPVEVRYFPLTKLARAKVGKTENVQVTNNLRVVNVVKWGTWFYRVTVEGSGLLKLSQGYDKGWISFGLPHVKVDGWANGWMIPQSGVATILYWPQLLGYLGFGLFGLTFILILRRRS